MDNFWAKLLILGIVAAIGVFFIANVYTPQKDAQQTMAQSTQQSVESVKAGVDGAAPMIVRGDVVVSTVNQYCKTGNTVAITLKKTTGATYVFDTATSSTSYSGGAAANLSITSAVDITKTYTQVITKNNNITAFITFLEQ